MLGMLQVVLRNNPIARRRCIPGQCEIFFTYLVGCAAYTYIRSVAIKHLGSVVIAVAIVMRAPAASIVTAAAPVTVASSCSTVSHRFFSFSCYCFY